MDRFFKQNDSHQKAFHTQIGSISKEKVIPACIGPIHPM